MPWHTLTIDDVLSEFTPQEQATLKGLQGAAETLPAILSRVLNAARGAIRAGGYLAGDEGTTPDQLDLDIIAVTRWRWLIAFPQLQRLQTRDRKEAHDLALARLDSVARQALRIESPFPALRPVSGSWGGEPRHGCGRCLARRPGAEDTNSETASGPATTPPGPADEQRE